jgi:hypothetical protein
MSMNPGLNMVAFANTKMNWANPDASSCCLNDRPFRRLKQRAPTGPDLFPDGAFERWKMHKLVKPICLDLSALKSDPEE